MKKKPLPKVTDKDNKNISKHLGAISEYKSTYDNSLLVPEPRINNRKHLDCEDEDDNLRFYGCDVWNAYEVTFLNANGRPVTGIAKIIYPATSKNIVESKSLKLYLNSFNMTNISDLVDEVDECEDVLKSIVDEDGNPCDRSKILVHDGACRLLLSFIISKDLTNILELAEIENDESNAFITNQVQVSIINTSGVPIAEIPTNDKDPQSAVQAASNFSGQYSYITLEDIFPEAKVSVYSENPDILSCIDSEDEMKRTITALKNGQASRIYNEDDVEQIIAPGDMLYLHSSLLFSRCRVTQQPDHGDVYIRLKIDEKIPNLESILQYISSFRNECHFHEEICETIYCRLREEYSPEMLDVVCLYTRRGGIDINPVRSSSADSIILNEMQCVNLPHIKTRKQ